MFLYKFKTSIKGFMKIEELDIVVKIAACVCGKDGVISQTEESKMYELVHQSYPYYSISHFNQILDNFFAENTQIEEYLEFVSDSDVKNFCLNLCEESASADGLDIKENIALQKVRVILAMKHE
jgi:hypothetical protein